jgi:hypothetical protein
VAFPLSATHHIETSKVTSPRQRLDLALNDGVSSFLPHGQDAFGVADIRLAA